jgi:hypothetical protein
MRDFNALEGEIEHVPAWLAAQPRLARWRLKRTRPWESALEVSRERVARCDREMERLRAMRAACDRELWRVRAAVDAELGGGRGRRCVVEALRLDPNRPDGVRELPDADTFVAEDPRRAGFASPHGMELGGEDYGLRWNLEDPIRRWETSQWRISWLGIDRPTYEVYAVEMTSVRGQAARRSGRVWILGRIESRSVVREALEELEFYAQAERNSLVAAARAVQRAAVTDQGITHRS